MMKYHILFQHYKLLLYYYTHSQNLDDDVEVIFLYDRNLQNLMMMNKEREIDHHLVLPTKIAPKF